MILFIYSEKGNPKERNDMGSCWGEVEGAGFERG